jgi:transposase
VISAASRIIASSSSTVAWISPSASRGSSGGETLSKPGNARLHMAFWMAAQRAVRMNENSFRDKYERYTRQEPGNPDVRRKALTAVAAKMARVAYAVVKHDQPYRGYHEHALPSGSIPLERAVEAHATP